METFQFYPDAVGGPVVNNTERSLEYQRKELRTLQDFITKRDAEEQQKKIDAKLDVPAGPKPTQRIKVGQRVRWNYDNRVYILALVGIECVCLIDLKDGYRLTDPVVYPICEHSCGVPVSRFDLDATDELIPVE